MKLSFARSTPRDLAVLAGDLLKEGWSVPQALKSQVPKLLPLAEICRRFSI